MTTSGPGSQVASRDVLNQVLKDESVLVQRSRDHQQAGSAARADPRQAEGEDGPAGLCLSHPSRALPRLSSLQAQGCCIISSQVSRLQALPFPVGPTVTGPLRRHAFKGAPCLEPPTSCPHAPLSHFSSALAARAAPALLTGQPGHPLHTALCPGHLFPFHPSHPNQSGGP